MRSETRFSMLFLRSSACSISAGFRSRWLGAGAAVDTDRSWSKASTPAWATPPTGCGKSAARRGSASGACLWSGDQACASSVRDEARGPADEDEKPVLEADEVEEVDYEPREPGDVAAQLEPFDV